MHGLGNDYVFVSLFDQAIDDAPRLAHAMSDRHRGVGSDGLILVTPPEDPAAHVRMIMYNADGSRAEMCGNGIRCLAKLAHEHGLARANPLRVETDRGTLTLDLVLDRDDHVTSVCVDMGPPILEPARIPVNLPGAQVVGHALLLASETLKLTCVSLGNPHAVFFVPNVQAVPLARWGPLVEAHSLFPRRTNAQFVQVLDPARVRMITWERGAGATQACGTGAAAVCVAGVLNNLTARTITAELPGGELRLEWRASDDHVLMTGPAVEVFRGEWPQ